MPEVQEVFRMATQKVRPDPGAIERQHRDQRRHVTKQKTAVYALIAALIIGGAVYGVRTLRSGDDRKVNVGSTPTPTETSIPSVTDGVLEPGTYAYRTLDPDFDASHRITVAVPDGYEGSEGFVVRKLGRVSQTGVSVWVVGDVNGDACRWSSTLLDPPPVSSVDDLAGALAGQRGLRVSTPTDITIDGFAGTHMERTVPARTNLDKCNGAEFRPWLATDGGQRYLEPGQHDLLWIVDVDGVPLLIDAALGQGHRRRTEPSSFRSWSPSGSILSRRSRGVGISRRGAWTLSLRSESRLGWLALTQGRDRSPSCRVPVPTGPPTPRRWPRGGRPCLAGRSPVAWSPG